MLGIHSHIVNLNSLQQPLESWICNISSSHNIDKTFLKLNMWHFRYHIHAIAKLMRCTFWADLGCIKYHSMTFHVFVPQIFLDFPNRDISCNLRVFKLSKYALQLFFFTKLFLEWPYKFHVFLPPIILIHLYLNGFWEQVPQGLFWISKLFFFWTIIGVWTNKIGLGSINIGF